MTGQGIEGRHFSGINTRILFDHVKERLGDEGVKVLIEQAGEDRTVDSLLDDTSWSSYDQFRRLLEAASELLAPVGGLEGVAEVHQIGRSTAPEFARTLQGFGSPMAMALEAGQIGASLYPIMALDPEGLAPTHLRWRIRMREPFEPFPELCVFLKGLLPQSVRLFGMRVLEISEESCQCKGARECVVDIHWDETEDLALQLDLARTKLQIAESRLEAFQDTVSDIVSAHELDVVLGRIVRSAARAVHAPAFVLAIDGPGGEKRLYTEGIAEEDAEAVVADDSGYLSVDVASGYREYGRLVAVAPFGYVSHERAALDSYARLAATALDSAYALEDARRQAGTAEALLQLSTSLAELSSVGELATKVARAIPEVIDCDASVVLLVTDGVARVAAHHGYPPDAVDEIERLEIPIDQSEVPQLRKRKRDELPQFARSLMDSAGLKAMASAPVTLDETQLAILVAGVRHGSERILDDAKLAERFAGLAGQAAVALRNGRLLDQIRHQSLHDPLTDLANRALIMDRAGQLLVRARRDHGKTALMFIDLDDFKQINDTLGHGAGDDLLREVAVRLVSTVRAADTVGRLGGDEFVVLTEDRSPSGEVETVARRILEAIGQPFQLPGCQRPVVIGASVGIALGDRPCAGDLLRDADIALYRAKALGKGRHCVFSPGMEVEALKGTAFAEDLAQSRSNDDLSSTEPEPIVLARSSR